jgi:hypothetical protein
VIQKVAGDFPAGSVNAVSVSAAAYAMALLVAHGRTGSRVATLPLPAPLARWLHTGKTAP